MSAAGDMPAPPKVKVGMLGARFERDPKTGYLRIARILKGQNWDRTLKNPLTEVGVNVKEGEYIIAVDGRDTSGLADIGEALYNKVGRQVTLKVNALPEEKGSREVVVVPVETENQLYYHTWVEDNIAKVDKATGGKVGYIHIPDMGTEGLNEFVKYFYPQLRKKALIIDVRGNGGGNVSPQIAERLMREMVMVEVGRNGAPGPDPGGRRPRAQGLPLRRVLGLRRRHLPLPVQDPQDGQAHRQADLGRRRRHPRVPAPARRRGPEQAGVRPLRRGREGSGSSKGTASIPTSSSTTIPPASSRGSTTSSTRPSRSSSKS